MSAFPARGNGSQTLVIGASQAGLAIGYHLRQRGLPFQIVDVQAYAARFELPVRLNYGRNR